MVPIPTVRETLSAYRLVLHPEQDLLQAIAVLVDESIPGAPVTDDEGRLVGLLTVKDCLRIVSRSAYGEPVGGTVAGYMSPLKAVLEPDMDLFAAVHVFLEGNFPVLPVLDQGELIGCVQRLDLLRHIHELDLAIERERERENEDRESWERTTSIEQMQKLAARYTG